MLLYDDDDDDEDVDLFWSAICNPTSFVISAVTCPGDISLNICMYLKFEKYIVPILCMTKCVSLYFEVQERNPTEILNFYCGNLTPEFSTKLPILRSTTTQPSRAESSQPVVSLPEAGW